MKTSCRLYLESLSLDIPTVPLPPSGPCTISVLSEAWPEDLNLYNINPWSPTTSYFIYPVSFLSTAWTAIWLYIYLFLFCLILWKCQLQDNRECVCLVTFVFLMPKQCWSIVFCCTIEGMNNFKSVVHDVGFFTLCWHHSENNSHVVFVGVLAELYRTEERADDCFAVADKLVWRWQRAEGGVGERCWWLFWGSRLLITRASAM